MEITVTYLNGAEKTVDFGGLSDALKYMPDPAPCNVTLRVRWDRLDGFPDGRPAGLWVEVYKSILKGNSQEAEVQMAYRQCIVGEAEMKNVYSIQSKDELKYVRMFGNLVSLVDLSRAEYEVGFGSPQNRFHNVGESLKSNPETHMRIIEDQSEELDDTTAIADRLGIPVEMYESVVEFVKEQEALAKKVQAAKDAELEAIGGRDDDGMDEPAIKQLDEGAAETTGEEAAAFEDYTEEPGDQFADAADPGDDRENPDFLKMLGLG